MFERKLENGTGGGVEYYQNKMKKRELFYQDGKLEVASRINYGLDGKRFERNEKELYAEGQGLAAEGQFYHAIEDYNTYVKKYPKSKLTPNVEFLIAFTYNNHLSDTLMSKKLYKGFIDKYPDHELKQSAEFELKTIGKDINDIPEFKKQ